MGSITSILAETYVHSTKWSPREQDTITLDSGCAANNATTRNVLCTYAETSIGYSPKVFNPIYLPWGDKDGKLQHDIIIHPDYQDPLKDIRRTIDILGLKPEDKETAAKSIESIRDLMQWDTEFKSEGRLERLSAWLSERYHQVPIEPQGYGATTNKETLMWTRPNARNEVLGINTFYDEVFNATQKQSGLTREELIEYGLTHEYMHLSQPKSFFKKSRIIVEADVELKLSHYFNQLSKEDKKYGKLAQYAYSRYISIVKAYVAQKNISVTEEELQQIIENNDIEGVIDALDSIPRSPNKLSLEEKCKGEDGAEESASDAEESASGVDESAGENENRAYPDSSSEGCREADNSE